MSRSRRRVALLTNGLLSSYQVALRDGLERTARQRGYDLLVVLGRELEHSDLNERTQNAIFDWVSASSVDGVIALSGVLVNFAGSAAVVRLLERLRLPAVSIGVELPGMPSIIVNNRAGTRIVVNHLLQKHQCRSIAYISGPPDNEEANERLLGYRDALSGHGLAVHDELVMYGRFTLPTGHSCMLELLDSGHSIDAVVAANDYMALGALDALRSRGIAVPDGVRVVGFDDSPLARLSWRPLTSVAQPAEAMAEAALEVLVRLIEGRPGDQLSTFAPRAMLRHSCGCGGLDPLGSIPPSPVRVSAFEFVQGSLPALVDLLREFAFGEPEWWKARSEDLVQGLARELHGKRGAFSAALEPIVESALERKVSLEHVRRCTLALKRALTAAGFGSVTELERIWPAALHLVSEASGRGEGRASLDLFERFIDLRYTGQRLSVALEAETIALELERSLPQLGVSAACVALFDGKDAERLKPLLMLRGGKALPASHASYARAELVPSMLLADERSSIVLMLLTFDSDVFGIFAVDGDASPLVCEMLRTHISAAVKLGRLQRRVIEETAARERADQQKLEGEIAIARQIQTALSPQHQDLPNLRVSSGMLPANAVGGDYHDVIPVPGGAWLCIADVSGHGLLSGLIMLMIQSMTTAVARWRFDESPAELLGAVNRALTPNIRQRLTKEEHATMVLVRFFDDGSVTFAGAHEDLIVYRRASGKVEIVPTDGVWIGILPDILPLTNNHGLRLEAGDMLVLYTDGFIEAMNSNRVQFGRERLCAIVEEHAPAGPEAVRSEMFRAVLAWCPVLRDDVSCVVAQFEPGATPAPHPEV